MRAAHKVDGAYTRYLLYLINHVPQFSEGIYGEKLPTELIIEVLPLWSTIDVKQIINLWIIDQLLKMHTEIWIIS